MTLLRDTVVTSMTYYQLIGYDKGRHSLKYILPDITRLQFSMFVNTYDQVPILGRR